MSNGSNRRGDAFLPGFPVFANELAGTLAVHSQYVLHGNIRDRFLLTSGGVTRPTPMLPLLWAALRPSGYQALICYDPVDGITVYPDDRAVRPAAAAVIGARAIGRRPALERLRPHLAKVVGVPEQPPLDAETPAASTSGVSPSGASPSGASPSGASPSGGGRAAPNDDPADVQATRSALMPKARVAFIVDYASRITRVPGQLDPVERDFFLYCQKLALTANPWVFDGPRRAPLFNPIIWLVEGERDLPAWFAAGAELIRSIAVGIPSLAERTDAARVLVTTIATADTLSTKEGQRQVTEFAKRTDGMTIQAMMEVVRLAKDRAIPLADIADAVRVYKLGVDDNPWRRTSVREQINAGEPIIYERIKGQDYAVNKTLRILKRAALGLSGAQATSSVSRPRGVLFFAGPTGVGKTELAKQVAELLFGDANAFLRFDMSEFSAEQAADRLAGAPPGYVGFEAGGELTGAVRRKPFQVVLFDEIEKAHPLVLDKFLQILEDGRLTDGQGVTTYFSECVLIFTSNLGVMVTDPQTGRREAIVDPDTPYEQLEIKVTAAIREHFTGRIGRPELLNRLGDNIVIFNFISKETAGEIFGLNLSNVIRKVQDELRLSLSLRDDVRSALHDACTDDPANGGRGIGNRLESHLINPLAEWLFARDFPPDTAIEVTSIVPGRGGAVTTLDAQVATAAPR